MKSANDSWKDGKTPEQIIDFEKACDYADAYDDGEYENIEALEHAMKDESEYCKQQVRNIIG